MSARKPTQNRRSIRLKDYDYAQAGAYFVTMVTHRREHLFGRIINGRVELSAMGQIVEEEWLSTPEHRKSVEMDAFVVMPDHIHGIIMITEKRDWRNRIPIKERFGKPVPGSLPTIVRTFKAAGTRRINRLRSTPGKPVWQRNYYEHVIRNERALNRIREYIVQNPVEWSYKLDESTDVKEFMRQLVAS